MLFGPKTPLTHLSGPFADLTIKAAFDGLGPATPTFAKVVGGKFGNYPLDGFEGEITAKETELRCVLRPKPNFTGRRSSVLSMGRLMNQPTRLVLADGAEIVAGLGAMPIS
jgi:hypothetical protein